MCECPQFVDNKIPKQNDDRGEDLHQQIIELGILDADVHDDTVDTRTRDGDEQKFCQGFTMLFLALKGEMVVENIIDQCSDNKSQAGSNHGIQRPELNQYDQGGVVTDGADSADTGIEHKLADCASVLGQDVWVVYHDC